LYGFVWAIVLDLVSLALEHINHSKMPLNRNYNGYRSPKPRDVYLETQLFSALKPISPFFRTAKQYFVDALFMTPVILVANTAASKQALSR
jgi:hypothetical protein